MKTKIIRTVFIYSVISFLLVPKVSFAEEKMNPLKKGTQELGIGIGYGSSIDSERYVESVPLNIHWGCIFTDPKGSSFFKGNWEVLVEGSISYLFHNQNKYGIGVAGLIRYNFFAGKKLVPYIQAGVGVWHTNLDMHNFPNDFTLSPQGGVGIQYFIKKNMAIRGEYRFQHFSNAGLYKNNTGLHMNNFWVGYAHFF